MKKAIKRLTTVLGKNRKQIIIGLLFGLLVAVPSVVYAYIRINNQIESTVESKAVKSVEQDSSTLTDGDNQKKDSTGSISTTESSPPVDTGSSQTNTSTGQSAPETAAPKEDGPKLPINHSFAVGTITPQHYPGTIYSSNGYTDEWAYFTPSFDSSGFVNMKMTYNCAGPSQCPSLVLQGSQDNSNWSNYKSGFNVYSGGPFQYAIIFKYYRLMFYSGACAENACSTRPSWAQPYEYSAYGYFYN